MIIAVVGGEGTGKTSLATSLARSLALPVLEPLKSQVLAESGYHTLFEWDAATKGLPGLIARQNAREVAFEQGIVDGGVLEILATVQRWAWNRVSPPTFERLRRATLETAARYDRVVLLPPDVVAGPAPGRFRDAANNLQLVRLLDAVIAEAGLRTLRVTADVAEARVEQVLSAVR